MSWLDTAGRALDVKGESKLCVQTSDEQETLGLDNRLNAWLLDLVSPEALDKDKLNSPSKESDLFVSRIVFRGSASSCVDPDVSNTDVDVLDIVERLDFSGVRSGDTTKVWIGFGSCDAVIGVAGAELDLESSTWNKDTYMYMYNPLLISHDEKLN